MSALPDLPPPDPYDARRPRRAPQPLAPFVRSGVLASADVHAAATLARLGGGVDDDALLGCAFAVRAPRLGHTCVDLATIADRAAVDGDVLVDPAALPWPSPEAWVRALAASPLAAAGAPLVLDGTRVYLDRYEREERQIADDLRRLLDAPPPEVDDAVLADGLARLFSRPGPQRDAAEAAVRSRVAVIAGGPGTGKTTTVARLVALHLEQARAAAERTPRIALAAPTGKAAARLTEAIGEQLDEVGSALDPAIRDEVAALKASTLHRLLGWRPGSANRFAHDRANRLPHDLVVVDETSMVSLTHMARLLEALRPDARLVLVGDPGQLASVEAGTVLGDLVAAAAAPGSPLHDATVTLIDPRRFEDEGGIAAVARAIHAGDADAVVAALRGHGDDVTWIEADAALPETDLRPIRERAVATTLAVRRAAYAGRVGEAVAALASFRLLLAHRRGPHGVSAWNRQVEGWTTPARERDEEWYTGRPVLVSANDASLGVFNGDLGVVVQHDGHRTVAFERRPEPLEVAPARLADAETVHAMTIHKSQGSQFETVAVLLPDRRSRLLTRELLYTGITRARKQLVVIGEEETVRRAVERPIDRASGLPARLAPPAEGDADPRRSAR